MLDVLGVKLCSCISKCTVLARCPPSLFRGSIIENICDIVLDAELTLFKLGNDRWLQQSRRSASCC